MKYLPFALFCLLFSVDAFAAPAIAAIAPALLTAFAGAAASAVVGKVFAKKDKKSGPQAPKVTPREEIPTAPTPDNAARNRQAERQQQRRYAGMGRAGTILSENNTLG